MLYYLPNKIQNGASSVGRGQTSPVQLAWLFPLALPLASNKIKNETALAQHDTQVNVSRTIFLPNHMDLVREAMTDSLQYHTTIRMEMISLNTDELILPAL